MSVKVESTGLNVLNMHTRFPFKYGIAALTAVPHLFVSVELLVDGERSVGVAADGLPPKWFTKDPESHFRDDLVEMFHVIESACGFAEQVGEAKSVFDLWQMVYMEQMRFGVAEGYPGLLWGFGVSLVERAMIDAFCKARGMCFAEAVGDNWLGIKLGELNKDLKKTQPKEWLTGRPMERIQVRHTVGLADALTDGEIGDDERVDDGLPQSLEACIEEYGLTHLKIKLCGDLDVDLARMRDIATLLEKHGGGFKFTLDGNEQFKTVEAFKGHWDALCGEEALRGMMDGLLFVEQALHRDVALSGEVMDEMLGWEERPGMIIDESDGAIGAGADALESGYVGMSHKNCKGVFKGIGNACLIAQRLREEPEGGYVISGEDLANVGPVALLQDLAVMSVLGIEHVERNGHHYFKGLSMYEMDVQQKVVGVHGDLYEMCEEGFARLKVKDGGIAVGSVLKAPFGVGVEVDVEDYVPLEGWGYDSLGCE